MTFGRVEGMPYDEARALTERDQEPLCNCQQSLALEKRLEVYRQVFEAIKSVVVENEPHEEQGSGCPLGIIGSLVALAEASLASVK